VPLVSLQVSYLNHAGTRGCQPHAVRHGCQPQLCQLSCLYKPYGIYFSHVAVDINSAKFDAAKEWGATDCINPKDHEKPIQQVINELTEWGCDYTVEFIHLVLYAIY
jgi:hypothetical protein